MWEYIIALFAFLSLYTEINFFIIKRRVKGPIKIMKGAESFFYKKGKTGALLIHGFTSTPSEFKDLSKTLTKQNITVFAPLLPGHGTSPERLSVAKYYQWIEKVDESIKTLAKECNNIYLIGNSMGSNLALISANKNKKIRGIIALGTPIYFKRHTVSMHILLPILKRIKLFQKKRYRNIKYIKKINKGRTSYDSIPLRSMKELLKIIKLSKQNLKKINKPTLVMQTKNDLIIDEESGNYIIKNINSKNKQLKIVPESYHVFILDKHKEIAEKEIINFIKNESSNR